MSKPGPGGCVVRVLAAGLSCLRINKVKQAYVSARGMALQQLGLLFQAAVSSFKALTPDCPPLLPLSFAWGHSDTHRGNFSMLVSSQLEHGLLKPPQACLLMTKRPSSPAYALKEDGMGKQNTGGTSPPPLAPLGQSLIWTVTGCAAANLTGSRQGGTEVS